MCMSSEYMFLMMVITDLSNPKHLIDVYLEPLIEELLQLWHVGVRKYDNAMDQSFIMWVALMWTVNDLPAYGMASGWSIADVMHIGKNVFDNIFNTMMDIKKKTKDNLNVRKDLKIIRNWPELELDKWRSNAMPKVVYTLTKEQNRRICEWIRGLKFLDGAGKSRTQRGQTDNEEDEDDEDSFDDYKTDEYKAS
ncbi:UNVERIFIED_CONTAM: hypothetical protein Slati_2966200 [Sesamum latifolium]|uniref:DUF4283 domain-containing protein n=1 Tax=Sesamum latifolium TaxID=2727402 RepID=A0AAW2VDT5_9LAMI